MWQLSMLYDHSCKILYIQIEKLMKYLKAEKACRTDLEMYVAVINAQKNTLENDTDKIRNELKEGEYTVNSDIFARVLF